MSKLVITIGDYGAGTIESAVENNEEMTKLRSGDSADARVLSELIAQDPTVSRVITLPVSHQFSPNSAGALTKEAIKFGFQILENPGTVKGFEDVTEVSIVGNVAPGIKSLNGNDVGQTGKESNADREAFIDGTVSKNGKTINVGTTNAFLNGQGHALGAVTELEKEGYTLSEFKAVSGEADELIKANGQFRSRALLGYMNRVAGTAHDHKGEDLIPLAKAQHALVSEQDKKADEAYAKQFLQLQNFMPVLPGDAKQGYVTVISSSASLDQTLGKWSGNEQFAGQLFSGMSYDGNETAVDKKVIAGLGEKDQDNYRTTRQAFLAATLANEYSRSYGSGPRTVILDADGTTKPTYDVELKNGSHIIATDPRQLALTLDTIAGVAAEGQKLQGGKLKDFLGKANDFSKYLKNKAAENDPYRNVKLGQTFGETVKDVKRATQKLTGSEEIPNDKAASLTITAKTGDLSEERTVYYVPSSTSSFGIWGHPKLSSGSTILDKTKSKENYQGEIFTPGCPTAGYLFTVVPGVTEFAISRVQLIDKSLLDAPSLRITGQNREYGVAKDVDSNRIYHNVHGAHVRELMRKAADEQVTPLGSRSR